jgi:hypothetical protein
MSYANKGETGVISKKEQDSQVVELMHRIEQFTNHLNKYVIKDPKSALGTREIFNALADTNLIIVTDDGALTLATISRMKVTIENTDDPQVKEVVFGDIVIDED